MSGLQGFLVIFVNRMGESGRIALRRLAWRNTPLFHALNRVYRPGKVHPQAAELIIDGFARSGNWFAYAAFRMAQPQPIKVCRHHHAPNVILEGIRLRRPTLLLVREPRDALISNLIARPERTVRELLAGYRDYYAQIEPWREEIVVATFDQVVTDFGAIVERINVRYATTFQVFSHSEMNVTACFEWLEQAQRGEIPSLPDGLVSRPSAPKDVLKHSASIQLDTAVQTSPQLAALMKEAEELYANFARTARAQAER